jgi:hypothetical protein
MKNKSDSEYTDKETDRRRDAAVFRALSTPHKPHKPLNKTKKPKAKKSKLSK